MLAGGSQNTLLSLFADSKLLWGYLIPAVIVASITLVGVLIDVVVARRLGTLVKNTPWRGDDIIVHSLRHKIMLWGFLIGVNIALGYLPVKLTVAETERVHQVLLVVFIGTLTFLAADLASGVIHFANRTEAYPAVSIVDNIVRVTVYIVGTLIVLQSVFNIDLGPAIAALGVIGLAVSLAMQATLTDLLSGIQIILARQIRPGEYVRLSTGEEGYVVDISWRTTTIRELSNNLVIIPNSKMTSTIVVNFDVPDTSISVLVNLGVSYDSDLEEVERITTEVAREVMKTTAGAVPESEPFIRYNLFGESSIRFSVILRGQSYTDQYLIQHEFIKALHKRYREEGISIPFPMRTIVMQPSAPDGHVRVPQPVGENNGKSARS